MWVSEATFYNWKKKYGSLGVTELRRLRHLEDENVKLKQIITDLSLDKQMLQNVLKKALMVSQLRVVAKELIADYKVSVIGNLKCRVFGNQECRTFGNNDYTINGNKSAEQVTKVRELS